MSAERLIGMVSSPDGQLKVTLDAHCSPIVYAGGKPYRLQPAQADELRRLLHEAVDASDRYGGARR